MSQLSPGTGLGKTISMTAEADGAATRFFPATQINKPAAWLGRCLHWVWHSYCSWFIVLETLRSN